MKTHLYTNIMLLTGFLCLPLQAALVAHYTFDSDFTDSSGNGNNGTLVDVGTTGNTTITTSDKKFGAGAISFSDDRDYITIANPDFQNGDKYTVAFWVKRNDANRTYDVVAGDIGDADNFLTFFEDDTMRYEGDAGNGSRIDRAHGITSTVWNHFAYVSDGSDITIYVNGSSVGSQTENTSLDITAVGAGYLASLESDFQGLVDEFQIYDEELTQTQIQSIVNINAVPEPSSAALLGLVGLGVLLRRRR